MTARAIELNQSCVSFLVAMFKANQNTKTAKLDEQALDRIFLPTETGKCPWDASSETIYENPNKLKFDSEDKEKVGEGITLESWVGLWIKYFNQDAMAAFRDLVLIGYCGQMRDAIHLVKFKPKDVNGVPKTRKSFNCLVVSQAQDLSSRFMDAFIHSDGRAIDPEISRAVVRTIKDKHPTEKDKFTVKYLILSEANSKDIENGDLFKQKDIASKFDIVLYLYEADDRDQIEFTKRAFERFKAC